ncbi:hypothetical protein [Nocardia sp. NPDC004260]
MWISRVLADLLRHRVARPVARLEEVGTADGRVVHGVGDELRRGLQQKQEADLKGSQQVLGAGADERGEQQVVAAPSDRDHSHTGTGAIADPAGSAGAVEVKSNVEVRRWYKDQVAKIPALDERWSRQGVSVEERARRAAEIRHAARLRARAMMSNPNEVRALRARDLHVYGNPDGPTFDHLVRKAHAAGRTGDDAYTYIIGSSSRTNAEVNKRILGEESR